MPTRRREPAMPPDLYVGVDIGGTFTDLVASAGDRLHSVKTLTTPDDPVRGVVSAVRQALEELGAAPGAIRRFVHATTLPTNLVLERKGARVAYVTTAGFGDIFLLSKQRPVGPDRFNIRYRRPEPLVPRERVFEVVERMDHRGRVLIPLDDGRVARMLDALAAARPESVAICLLHAYANPAHEQRLGALVRARLPDTYVALSSEVWPEYQEYERASTTVLSAYIGPTFAAYVGRLEQALRDLGIGCPLQIMQSSGGVMSAAAAAGKSAYVIESGPAAGVIAAASVGLAAGYRDLISFDMGGTTAKAGLVQRGEPRITHDFRVGGRSSSGARDSGEPIRVPVIDLAEVGAGGGSIARIDAGGFLQVGPESAGAAPGPACYGFGGTEPTVTDANLLLGYIDPDYFLGGRMPIDPALSRAALARLGERLGFDAVRVAAGIHDLANAHMASAIRVVTLQRGIDPRDHALVATGGAGPLHVVRLAEQFDIPTVIVPPAPGVKSAFGLLVSDLAYDYVATAIMPVAHPDLTLLDESFARLEGLAAVDLAIAREGRDGVRLERSLDMRFASQAMDLAIPVPARPADSGLLAEAEAAFRQLYFATTGMRPSDPCRIVNCRLRAIREVPKPPSMILADGDGDASRARKGDRPGWFAPAGFTLCPVYDRGRLLPGDRVSGPAFIEEADSTTVCPPGWEATVGSALDLMLHRMA